MSADVLVHLSKPGSARRTLSRPIGKTEGANFFPRKPMRITLRYTNRQAGHGSKRRRLGLETHRETLDFGLAPSRRPSRDPARPRGGGTDQSVDSVSQVRGAAQGTLVRGLDRFSFRLLRLRGSSIRVREYGRRLTLWIIAAGGVLFRQQVRPFGNPLVIWGLSHACCLPNGSFPPTAADRGRPQWESIRHD